MGRVLFLNGQVDEDAANLLVSQLLWLELEEPGVPIRLIINSSGGKLFGGFAVVDAMRWISSPVYTICLGRAESMAAVILAAGKPGHRGILPNARVMIHEPTWDL